MAEWFEDEFFWIELYPFMFPDKTIDRAEQEVEKIPALTGFEGGSILDLCCGPGRHAIELAKRGFQVTGVDRTPFLLEKAKEKAQQEGVEVEWVEDDMREFVRPKAFDLVLSMFTSFGYFDNKEEDIQVLRNVFQSLKPGGSVVLEMTGKERLAKIFQPTTSTILPDGSMLVERHEIFDEWTRVRNEWIIIREGKTKSFTFHHTIYSGQELRDRLEQVGFREVKLYGSLDGDEYGPDARRLLAAAKKPRP